MATAGSGDVLTGIVGGFILKCRGTELPAEALGAYFHGKTGCIAAKSSSESSVIASDIVKAINI